MSAMIDMLFDDETEEYSQIANGFGNAFRVNEHNAEDTLGLNLIEPDYLSTSRQLIEAYREEKQLRKLVGECYDDWPLT
jgi:hypothetical protein